jgi:3-deoxy-D-manno-octulosonic-acid transferase
MSAFLAVRRAHPPARLILVPRHPVRAGEVVELARRSLPHVQRYSTVDAAQPWEVLVVDVMGVLSRLYALASLSFVGGSLVRKGGQNPLESAAAGCPVFFGPDMSDFPDIARWLLEAGAARTVADGAELGARWIEVLQDEGARTAMREACRGVIAEHCGCTTAIAEEVSALISG